jgi:hypothetical protein
MAVEKKKKKVVVGSLASLACEGCLYFFACRMSMRALSLSFCKTNNKLTTTTRMAKDIEQASGSLHTTGAHRSYALFP